MRLAAKSGKCVFEPSFQPGVGGGQVSTSLAAEGIGCSRLNYLTHDVVNFE